MDNIRRALWKCWTIQAALIFVAIIYGLLLRHGVTTVHLRSYTAIIFIPNFIICNKLFTGTLRKKLKDISPSAYEELFNSYPFNNSIKFLLFAFSNNADDTEYIKKIKTYIRNCYLINLTIFIELILITVFI